MTPGTFLGELPHERDFRMKHFNDGYEAGKADAIREMNKTMKAINELTAFRTATGTFTS